MWVTEVYFVRGQERDLYDWRSPVRHVSPSIYVIILTSLQAAEMDRMHSFHRMMLR